MRHSILFYIFLFIHCVYSLPGFKMEAAKAKMKKWANKINPFHSKVKNSQPHPPIPPASHPVMEHSAPPIYKNDRVIMQTADGVSYALDRKLIEETSPFLHSITQENPNNVLDMYPFGANQVHKVMEMWKGKKYEDTEWLQVNFITLNTFIIYVIVRDQSSQEINEILLIAKHMDLTGLLDNLYEAIVFLQDHYFEVVKHLDSTFQQAVFSKKRALHKEVEMDLLKEQVRMEGSHIILDNLDTESNLKLKKLVTKASFLFDKIEIQSAASLEILKESNMCRRAQVFINIKKQKLEPKNLEGAIGHVNVEHISITYCRMSSKSVSTLSQEISKCPNLSSLSLDGINLKDDGAKSLSMSFRNLKYLESLSMSHNKIGNKGLSYIINGLDSLYVRELSFDDNQISNIKPLADAATRLPFLNYINFNQNRISGDSVASVINAFGETTSQLKTLLLRNNKINDQDGKEMAINLPESSIVSLDLQENNLKRDAVSKLVENLPDSSVKYLGLAYNNLNEKVANDLVDGLKDRKIRLEGLTLTYKHYSPSFQRSFEGVCNRLRIAYSLETFSPDKFRSKVDPMNGDHDHFHLFRVVENDRNRYDW